jgi:hypothetical protein
MELDELKQSWQRSALGKPSIPGIRELLHNREYGPIAHLRRRFGKRLIVIPLAMSFLILNLSRHHDIFSDILFWVYVAICIALVGYFYFNYRLLGRMQDFQGQVKANLERQVSILEKGIRWRLAIIRILFVFFIVLLEILLYYHQEPSLVKWYARPIGLRIAGYAALCLLFYLFTGFVIRHKYSKHVSYLRELVKQMEE